MDHFRLAHANKNKIKYSSFTLILSMISISLLLSSCSQQMVTFTPEPTIQEVIEQVSTPVIASTKTSQYFPVPYFVWMDPSLPEAVHNKVSLQSGFEITNQKDLAHLCISSARDEQIGDWTYLVVAPFYSKLKNVQFSDVSDFWKTGSIDIPGYNQLLMSEKTKIHISQFWGEPHSDGIEITDPGEILERAWYDIDSLAIIPFEELVPSYKVISIDNQNPLISSGEDNSYQLTFPIYLTVLDPSLLYPVELGIVNNFDRSKLTSVALTGVTAMVRDTAAIMEEKGILYPGIDVRDILNSADITHINNEVPFALDCPSPNPSQNSLSFCSSDSYLDLLESVGTDIVELSGDHFADHGPEAMLHTLVLYEQHDLITYGGGSNYQTGLDPVTINHNGNKISFIGCNAKKFEGYATASETRPGASACDFEWMIEEINRLAGEGNVVIATMQHEEVDSYFPISLQLYDFRRLSEAGASIVSGSQAHHPQGVEITGSKFIHYGLGNLFFDQWYQAINNPEEHINKDKAFIDFHYIYDGKYINTILIPLQFIDNARPRVMTENEEAIFLKDVYKASKWNNNWIYLYPTRYYYEILEN